MNYLEKVLYSPFSTTPQGSQTELSGPWGRVYVEQVTIGENNDTNMLAAFNTVIGARTDKSGIAVAIRRVNELSPAPAANEFGSCVPRNANSGQGYRYVNGAWRTTTIANNYDGALSPSSVFDVISVKQESL